MWLNVTIVTSGTVCIRIHTDIVEEFGWLLGRSGTTRWATLWESIFWYLWCLYLQGTPLLLTRIKVNYSMDRYLYTLSKMWDEITYLFPTSTMKPLKFRNDKSFHPTLYNGCMYLSMPELTLIHYSKRVSGIFYLWPLANTSIDFKAWVRNRYYTHTKQRDVI